MLQNFQREINLLHKLVDMLAVTISWLIAYFLRFKTLRPEHLWYTKYIILLILFQYYFFRRYGLYSSQRLKSIGSELIATLKSNTSVIVSFILSIYFFSPEKISRIVLINYAIISTILVLTVKLSVRSFLRYERSKGKNLRYVLLIGDGKQNDEFIKILSINSSLGLKVRAWADSNGLADKHGIPNIKDFDKSLFKNLDSDYVVIGYPLEKSSKVDGVLKICSNELLNIMILPDIGYALIGHNISDFSGLPTISINQPNFSSKSILLKRFFDFSLSALGLILISPLLALIAVGVKLSSPGPVFFVQKRIGLDGKEFRMWKFRSMKIDSESNGAGWTTVGDPRKTRFGSFIRKTSLDELPQLINVFIGEMSLVGPRPEQPYYVEKFKDEIPTYMLRHRMKAGITGWAQVNGWRGDTSISSRIECDIWYIKNWSIWLDIEILFMTIWKGFNNKNGY